MFRNEIREIINFFCFRQWPRLPDAEGQPDDAHSAAGGRRRAADLRGAEPGQLHPHVEEGGEGEGRPAHPHRQRRARHQ